jgi:hypothetical protein
LTAVRRPPQHELLRARLLIFGVLPASVKNLGGVAATAGS